jgi:hypothetical protein
MTQAFNLSQLANNLNTSGQLDATDGLTGAVPVANGGTGQTTYSNGQLLIGNGSGLTKANITAGSGISVTNGSGTITIATSGGGGVTSLNGQTGAITNTDLGAIGSYIFAVYAVSGTSSLNTYQYISIGSTYSGSSLRYNFSGISNSAPFLIYTNSSGTSYGGGGTALSGTWRAVMNGVWNWNQNIGKGVFRNHWFQIMFVRVS